MTQLCCYRIWDGSLERFKRGVLILSVIDLFIISAVIAYVGISLYQVSFIDPPLDPATFRNSDSDDALSNLFSNETDSAENETRVILCGSDETGVQEDVEVDCPDGVAVKYLNATGRFFPVTPYFQVVGYRIAKSIQLIIYTVQLFVTVYLIRGLMRTNTHCMRTWLIVTEIITTIILLVLLLYLFGDFKGETVLILAAYLVYQFIMIRTVARLIRRTEIELTQFGSLVEI